MQGIGLIGLRIGIIRKPLWSSGFHKTLILKLFLQKKKFRVNTTVIIQYKELNNKCFLSRILFTTRTISIKRNSPCLLIGRSNLIWLALCWRVVMYLRFILFSTFRRPHRNKYEADIQILTIMCYIRDMVWENIQTYLYKHLHLTML